LPQRCDLLDGQGHNRLHGRGREHDALGGGVPDQLVTRSRREDSGHEAHDSPDRLGCPLAVQVCGEGLHVAVAHLDEAHLTEP
jgi:hypothetical protein